MFASKAKMLQNTCLMDMPAVVYCLSTAKDNARGAHKLAFCVHLSKFTMTAGTTVHRGQGVTALPRQDLHQDASRHRYRFAPPATPNGFWDMGFGDSQDSRSG